MVEEEEGPCGTRASGEEEREPGWEKAWSLGGICGGLSSCSQKPETERAWKRLFLEERSGGAGLRGGNTGFSSKQQARAEVQAEEGDGGGR